jgi:hypothetical protein
LRPRTTALVHRQSALDNDRGGRSRDIAIDQDAER